MTTKRAERAVRRLEWAWACLHDCLSEVSAAEGERGDCLWRDADALLGEVRRGSVLTVASLNRCADEIDAWLLHFEETGEAL